MTMLRELASIIRSKNAGPFCLTVDIMFEAEADYRRVVRSRVIARQRVARLYHVPAAEVHVIRHDVSRAIKIAMPRLISAGDVGDTDMYGAQQHVPMLDLEIPEDVG